MKSLTARGIPVERSFYSNQEPFITHGTIELENSGDSPVSLAVEQVRCLAGNDVTPIEDFFLYLLPDYVEGDPDQIELPANTTSQYEVSFPRLSAVPYLSDEIQIEVTFTTDRGERFQARSPYHISRRTLKRR
jgi:hypothetical protein